MTAPLTGAMLTLYRDPLGWVPDRRYVLLNRQVSGGWDWGDDWGQPQALGALRRVLALDPELRLLVAHGLTDLVTPYFGSELILRQLPAPAADRVRQATYRAATCSTCATRRAAPSAKTPGRSTRRRPARPTAAGGRDANAPRGLAREPGLG